MSFRVIVLILFCCTGFLKAQNPVTMAPVEPDGLPRFSLETTYIVSPFASEKHRKKFLKQQQKFDRLRYNVQKVYPFAKIFSMYFTQLHLTLQKIEDKSVREAFKNSVEKDLFQKYEKDLRNMTITQGAILIKLLHREGGQTAYQGIKDLKSGSAAFFWQGIARLFGNNLKSEYDAEEEAAIEQIIQEIESGEIR